MDFIQKKWGYEIWIENNSLYCGKHLHVVPNRWCSVHYHKNKKETFYVISGTLKLQYSTSLDKEEWKTNPEEHLVKSIILEKGQSFTINPMTAHRFTAQSHYPCDFIEISTFHEDSDSYRIIEAI
jgi:mannose-6-phosphate isomerase-like protein (cupin superfamily)